MMQIQRIQFHKIVTMDMQSLTSEDVHYGHSELQKLFPKTDLFINLPEGEEDENIPKW